jgi:hypothetical protein
MRFKDPKSNTIIEIKHPKLWTLIFGSFFFAKHRAWFHTIISAILAIFTGGISCIIYTFFGAWIIRNAYIAKGWVEVGDNATVSSDSSDYEAVVKFDKLIKSRDKGFITEEEFNRQKKKLFHLK